MNEQTQWQECQLEEATHAKMPNGSYSVMSFREGKREFVKVDDLDIFAKHFPTLGIIPVRKVDVKALELTGRVSRVYWHRSTGMEVTLQLGDQDVPRSCVGMLMKVVEVQP